MKDEGVKRMKDEGGRMKESQERSLQHMNKPLALAYHFPFSIHHFSFFISCPSSFIL